MTSWILKQATINPVFAGYAAQQLQEAVGGIQRVFDNLFDIAKGKVPDANGYDRLRSTRVLYDRGMGKVTRNRPRTPTPESEKDPKSAEFDNQTNHSSDIAAESTRPAAQLEHKLDDALGPPQAPTRLDEPGHLPAAPGYEPDLVREAQYYVLEITNYGADLAKILAYIHEPDPERHLHQAVPPHHRRTDDTRPRPRSRRRPRNCHSITGMTPHSNQTGPTSTPPRSTPRFRWRKSSKPTATHANSWRTAANRQTPPAKTAPTSTSASFTIPRVSSTRTPTPKTILP